MPDVADRYRRLAARLTAVVDAVPDGTWSRPSPCDGWTAEDVLGHVATTEWDFLTARGLAPGGAEPPEAPSEAWPFVRDLVQDVLDDPARADTPYDGYFGPTTFAASVDTFYAMDLVVHGWDLAHATGLEDFEPMPADEVERILDQAHALGDNLRLPGVCGPAIEIGPDASRQDQLLAYLGRRP